MTLLDLFSPLISYIVTCRHDAACGKAPDEEVLLSHIMREFARIRKTGSASPDLQAGLDDACRYTAFYIDYMIHEGHFPYAQHWQDLGRSQYNELAGDEKFFDYMRGWLAEDTPLARAHLRLMYEMVASGFSGSLERRSVRLEELMRRTAEQLALMPEAEAAQALLRQRSDQERRSVRPRHPILVGLGLTGLGLIALIIAFSHYLHCYRSDTDDLRRILSHTREHIENKAMRHALNSDTLVAAQPAPQQHPSPAPPADETTPASGLPSSDTPMSTTAADAAAAIAPVAPAAPVAPSASPGGSPSEPPAPSGSTPSEPAPPQNNGV